MTASALPAILTRSDEPWNGTIDDELVAEARRHDVGPLLYHVLSLAGAWERQSSHAHDAFAQMAAEAVLFDELSRQDLRQVLDALATAGLAPLLFKGAALAYRHYARPWLRPRLDTDLLIREDEADDAAAVFERLGYLRVPRPTGKHVTHQFNYRTTSQGICLEYDVHCRLLDPQVFSSLLSYDELAREAVPVPPLGPAARAIGDVHALIVACTHRVAHHYDTESLLWLYDIDLLVRRLDERGWTEITGLASERRVRQVCARGLGLAADLFGAPVPPEVWAHLTSTHEVEPTAAYLRPHLRRVDILCSNLHALGGWRVRAQLLREHLLPAPRYILASYGQTRASLLPVLYVHRILRGAFKWFRPLRRE
jgi:putative nucleotidyltransferase-like protein